LCIATGRLNCYYGSLKFRKPNKCSVTVWVIAVILLLAPIVPISGEILGGTIGIPALLFIALHIFNTLSNLGLEWTPLVIVIDAIAFVIILYLVHKLSKFVCQRINKNPEL